MARFTLVGYEGILTDDSGNELLGMLYLKNYIEPAKNQLFQILMTKVPQKFDHDGDITAEVPDNLVDLLRIIDKVHFGEEDIRKTKSATYEELEALIKAKLVVEGQSR